MCNPGFLFAGGALISIGAGVMSYRNQAAAADAASANALASGLTQSQMFSTQQGIYQAQAGAFGAQAALHEQTAGMFVRQAGMFGEQADWSKRLGEIASAHEFSRARQAEKDAEREAMVASEKRRLKVGAGLAAFAGNNVSVDASSSVAIWEQDEIADLAYEMDTISEQRDNDVWGYVYQGHQHALQGLFDAQAYVIQAEGALINSQAAQAAAAGAAGQAAASEGQARIAGLQSNYAIAASEVQAAQYQSQADNAMWGLVGSVGGTLLSAGAFGAGGGFGGNSTTLQPYSRVPPSVRY